MSFSRRNWLALGAASLAPRARAADPVKRGMIVRSARPEDLEMPLDGFATWITPAERFFVRHHHYAAAVDRANWKLEVGGLAARRLSLSYEQLRKLPRRELVAVLECAGNGRAFYQPAVPGLQWEHGAVANGRWTGVRLADVLKLAGVRPEAREVLFDGADQPIATMPKFQRTLPLAKAMHPDTLLAYELNGHPLPALHGYPLRLVAPGWAGDSWTKWVTRITLLDHEFDGFFMKTAYRYPIEAIAPGAAVPPEKMAPVTELKVKSVIASPSSGVVAEGPLTVSGAAWAGVSPLAGVEVSIDGIHWASARLSEEQAPYAWRLWDYTVPRDAPRRYTIMARAFDAAGNRQPANAQWNPSGYLWNAIPRVEILVGTPELSAEFRRACLGCHELDVIAQQKLTRSQWEREVDKMMKWGAAVKPEGREEILKFLVRRFGPPLTRR